jgi:hypothetical protein
MVTLALEASLLDENWSESDRLFEEREILLGDPKLTNCSLEALEQIRSADSRMLVALKHRKAVVLTELAAQAKERRASQLYVSSSSAAGFDGRG